MPEVFRRRVADRSVREALAKMRDELLPGEIREDSVANWVMNFDELQRGSNEGDQWSERSRNPAVWAVNLVVITSLQNRIPFYFGTLFHIGRQWKVSESALRALDKASDRRNLALSTQLTLNYVRRRKNHRLSAVFERQGDTAEALSVLLDSAGRVHSDRLGEARRWWKGWREEVGHLRSEINGLQELGGIKPEYRLWRESARFVLEGSRPSALRVLMEQRGLKFAGESDRPVGPRPVAYPDILAPLLVLGLASLGKEPYFEHFLFEWRDVFYDFEQEFRYGELRRAALNRLNRKYGHGEDPFEIYLPMRKPASEQLRYMCIEHRLPGHLDSPWLDSWQRCLDDDPQWTVDFFVGGAIDTDTAAGFARMADSTIKRHIQDDYNAGETWEQFIQRLFEFHWVYHLARQMASANRKGNRERWSFEFCTGLVLAVVNTLNSIGYRLTTPGDNRLKRLWERLREKEPEGTLDW